MIEHDVQIETRAGMMHAFSVHPEGDGPYPAVIFYMDAPGYRDELEDMARRIARAGYYVLLPDLYYRLGTIRMVLDRSSDNVMAVMRAVRNTMTNEMVIADTAGMLVFLDTQDVVKPGPIGTVGHCMSGSYIVATAATYPSRIKAAAAFYGTQIITDQPDSPHLVAGRITGEIYLSFAETDSYVPDNIPGGIQAIFEKSGVRHTVEVVPGTHHGYAFPLRPAHDPEAAEAGFQKLCALFDRNLQ
ncbi:MAG TPA: dienelactone hydrolase family protein [Hyphomicrobiaceae bacterium]|nr:dienelactone hydrolase family protein [Hyphomicrobiaceae bacterium]